MKIDTEAYMTVEEVAEAIGAPNKRPVYRAILRAREAGKEVTTNLFGKTLIPREMVAVLKEFYFPYYSEQHQKMVREWGAAGGTQKRLNREAGVRSTKRRST
jgi:hypothetical protein